MFRGIRQYLTEAWSELKKVAWPTRQTVINLTLIVLAVSIAVGSTSPCSTPPSTP